MYLNIFGARVNVLESKLAVLGARDARIDENEQYSRRFCLRFNGIPLPKEGNKEDCVKNAADVMENLDCGVGKEAIDRAHRTGSGRVTKGKPGKQSQQEIVRFKSFSKRTAVYRVSQKKVPTFENSYQQQYFTDLNDSTCS